MSFIGSLRGSVTRLLPLAPLMNPAGADIHLLTNDTLLPHLLLMLMKISVARLLQLSFMQVSHAPLCNVCVFKFKPYATTKLLSVAPLMINPADNCSNLHTQIQPSGELETKQFLRSALALHAPHAPKAAENKSVTSLPKFLHIQVSYAPLCNIFVITSKF